MCKGPDLSGGLVFCKPFQEEVRRGKGGKVLEKLKTVFYYIINLKGGWLLIFSF